MNKQPRRDDRNGLRKRAEAELSGDETTAGNASPEEIRELVHELRTHQIELELQNEELRNAQAQLAENRDRYVSLYDFAPVGYATVSGKGIIRQANLTLTEMLGVPRNELIGRRFSALVIPEDGDSFHRYFRDLSTAGLKRSCELRLRQGQGDDHCIWVLLESVVLPADDAAEGAMSIRCTVSDITEHTQAKVMVAAVDAMREGVVLMQLDGTVISVNPATERLTGLTQGDLIGKDIESLLAGTLRDEDLAMLLAALPDIRDGRTTVLRPVVFNSGEGKRTHVMPSVTFITLPGAGTETAVLTLSDVTDQITLQQELSESEAHYRTLVEQLPAITYLAALDEVNTRLYVSPQAFRILGVSPDGFTQDPGLWLRHVYKRDRQRVLDGLKTSRETGADFSTEYRMVTDSGETVWFHDSAVIIRDEHGHPTALQGVMFDVTERRQSEAELTRQRRQLRALASELSLAEEHERRRLATELHDQCGQTLTLAQLKSQMLGQYVGGEEGTQLHREILGLISQASDQVRTFTFELSPPVLYEVGLGAALEWLTERFEQLYGVPATCDSHGNWRDMPETTSVFLFQSARELLANVGKHARARTVSVRLGVEGGLVEVSVADDGVGFDARTIVPAGLVKRSFGLFSIRERMHHIGGSMDIRSQPGEGAKLILSVPIGSTTEDPAN